MHKRLLFTALGFLLVISSGADEVCSSADVQSRGQLAELADKILAEVKFLDEVKDQIAVENNLPGDATVSTDALRAMLPEMLAQKITPARRRLAETLAKPGGPKDLLGNAYEFGRVDTFAHVHPATVAALKGVVKKDFWGPFVATTGKP